MKMSYRIKTEVTLILDDRESAWLQGFIQNYPGDPAVEDPDHMEMRRELFDKLKEARK